MAYSKSLEVYPFYIQSPSDTLTVRASLSNPENHPVNVYAFIHGKQFAFKDSIQLFDDIAAGENATSSSTYTLFISEECPGNTEVSIVVNISSYDHICWSDTFSIMVKEPVNIKEIIEPITRIYPNPTDNMLTIEISNADKQGIEIEILDITGKIIYQEEFKNSNPHFVE